MTFLTPLPAIIAACVAVPLLLLYYFLKLRRRAVRVSSTLLWERTVKDLQVNTPFRWIRFSLLLLIQFLILSAMLLALARPALPDPLGATRRVILLIDRSASMDAMDGIDISRGDQTVAASRVSRLVQAKLESERILDKLSGTGWFSRFFGSSDAATSVSLIEFAATPRVRTPFTTDYATVREAIDSIAQTDQPGNLVAAMQLVSGLASGSSDESQVSEPVTVFVFSDGSFPHEAAELTMPRAMVRFVQIGPTPVEAATPANTNAPAVANPATPAPSPPPAPADDAVRPTENLGITALSARRDAEAPSTVRVFARVQSNVARTIRGVARLTVNGASVQSRSFVVGPTPREATATGVSPASAPDSASPAPAGAPPPSPLPSAEPARSDDAATFETPVTFEIEHPEGGTFVVSLSTVDLLASDNAAAVVLAAASKPRILVVALDGNPDELLMLALEGLAPAALTSVEPAYYEQFAAGGRVIDAAGNEFTTRLSDWDLVVFDRYRPERLPPSPSISIGAGLPVGGLSVRPETDAASSTHFSTWRRTHPIMRSVNLDGILVSPPMRLGLPDSPQINATALAWGDSSNSTAGTSPLIALLEPVGGPAASRGNASPDAPPSTLGGAKRLVLAFELAQTNWGIEFSFPVFMVNAVEYLALQQTGLVSRSYRTEEPISLSVAASAVPAGAREAAVDGPLKLTVPIRRARTGAIQNPNENAPVEIVVGSLERAGVYAVRAGGVDLPSGSGTIAVNLVDTWESRAAVATGLDLPESPAARQSAAEAESRREVWHWLVAFALVLLAIEWVFFTRGMRA